MRVGVLIDGDRSEGELRSLHSWLTQEPAVRRSAELAFRERSSEPGSMGGVLDVLELVTGNGWSAASFVLAVAAWRQTRPRAPQVTIRRGDVEVSICNGSEDELAGALALLEGVGGAGPNGGPDGGDGPRQ
ncbi:effector-associated constant component EACC1 [Streptomyces chartreusis]|uniref:effector-associated constant component EACC1 n=1 Tax=Streptomyces chartreusis TaxID=1969 RepID=UPI0036737B3F